MLTTMAYHDKCAHGEEDLIPFFGGGVGWEISSNLNKGVALWLELD